MNVNKNVIIELLVILLLMQTLGCVSEYDVKPFEHSRKPTVAPTVEPDFSDDETNKPIATSNTTTSLSPVIVETYDDEKFITWTLASMNSIRSQTTVYNRNGNWGKNLKEDVEEDLIELKEFHVSPENQKVVEQYEHALEAYRLAGNYAEFDPSRTDFSEMGEALTCLGYGEFQFGIVEVLLKPDTMLMNEPAEYTAEFSLNRFSLPMDIIIPVGTTIKWQNRELKRVHRNLISDDGLWEEPIEISYMRYHEYNFNETGTFTFSLKNDDIPDTQTITVI